MKKLATTLFTVVLALLPGLAMAERMDSETQNLVIERLEGIISSMNSKDSSYTPSNLRLADLLSERARARFMNEVEANCKDCKGSKADREKALDLYEKLFPKAAKKDQGKILFQMAHLYEMSGQDKKSAELYEKILKSKSGYSSEVLRKSRLSLADLQFSKSEYKKASKNYEEALKTSSDDQGFINYRLAWCQFNLGQLDQAVQSLEKLAAHPELLTSETTNGLKADENMHIDVLHDLSTFYTRRNISANDIQKIKNLTPKKNQKEVLLNFAEEADRTGQKQAASDIYKSYLALPGLSKEEKLNVRLQLAQAKYDKGSDDSLEDFQIVAAESKACESKEKCEELQKRMKKYVIELHRAKKVAPDQKVLKAYEIYNKTYPKDFDMALRAANVADAISRPQVAMMMYASVADQTDDDKQKEQALESEISAAEKTKDLKNQEIAYRHYLKLSSKGPRAYEVKYQLAGISYDRKQWMESAEQYHDLALDSNGTAELRKKSADLSLDALTLVKKDEIIEKWSKEYAENFKSNQSEYLRIYRKAVNAQIVGVANNDKSSTSEFKKALKKALETDLAQASDQEKILHFKNISVLATKSEDVKAQQDSYDGLLAIKSLSAVDREQTLSSYVGLYEKSMDFKSAYYTALKMRWVGVSASEKELRLGTLADLSNLPAGKHYQKAINAGLTLDKEMSLRQRLVFLSSSPLTELRKQESKLLKNPSLFAETLVLIYGKNQSDRGLEKYLKMPQLASEPGVRFIRKQFFYPAQEKFNLKISSHRLDFSSDSKLQKSIKTRMKYLKEADVSLQTALNLTDYTAQIMALDTIKNENARFQKDLLSSPMPAGLTDLEKKKYTEILTRQSAPFSSKSALAAGKLEQLYQQKHNWKRLASDLIQSRLEIQAYLNREVEILIKLTTNSEMKSALKSAFSDAQLSEKDLEKARENVKQNPNDISDIEKLKMVETKVGHPLMASYLERRLGRIQKGKTL